MDDTWTIILALAALNIGLFAWLRSDMRRGLERLEDRLLAVEKEQSRTTGKLDLVLQGLQIRIEPTSPA